MDKVQRLILINQYRILQKLEENSPHPDDSYQHAINALQHNFELDIQQLVSESAWEGGLNAAECRELMDIFDMFRRITHSIAGLDAAEREEIEALSWMKFTGFDGNNESTEHSYPHRGRPDHRESRRAGGR